MATGRVDLSIRGSNMQHRAKKLTDVAENVLKRQFIDSRSNLCWGQRAVEAEKVCDETRNVRSGHGGSADNVGPPIVPSGSDVQAGSEDINGCTIIGEEGSLIVDIRSGDSDRLRNAGRRVVGRVVVVVSSSYGDGDATIVELKVGPLVSGVAVTFHPLGAYRYNGLVEGVRRTATQAQRSNRRFPSPPCCFDDPEYTSDTVIQ